MSLTRFAVVALLLLPAAAPAQDKLKDYLRTSPQFIHAFEDVVATINPGVVRVQCDEKDTALGTIVGADGWVLTKANDLKGKITCRLADGKTLPARYVGVDERHDLALLKIDAKGLRMLELGDSKTTHVGNWVASAGNSAEPVAIGVISVPTRDTKGPKGVIDFAKLPYLGVSLEPADMGIKVTNVQAGTAAAKAGILNDDVIRSLDGTDLRDTDDFIAKVAQHKPGDTVTLKIKRGDAEKEIRATLQSRPTNSARSDFQNHMGSELSSRRTGYPTILQHDSVLKPADCGGPLVDLDGRVVGINISRAGRVESWAIPAEVARALLPALKSGKLAPKIETPEVAKVEPKTEKVVPSTKTSEDDQRVDAMLSTMRYRLRLMPQVARSKWNGEAPGRDEQREARLLDKMSGQAAEFRVEADAVRRLFEAQIDAAWLLQQNLFTDWQKSKKGAFRDTKDLRRTLRPRVDEASQDLLEAYAQLKPLLDHPGVRERLKSRGDTVLAGDGITDAVRQRALEPFLKR